MSAVPLPKTRPATTRAKPAHQPAAARLALQPLPVVCQVLHSLNIGGAEVLAYQIAKSLAGRFEFVFACLDEVGPLGHDLLGQGIRVEHLQRKPGFDRSCARRLAAFVRDTGAAVVHAHQYTPFFYALASSVLRRRPPVLFTEHGRWYPDYRRWKRVLFNRLTLRRADRVVGVGESVRQALIHNEGISASRVKVIHNGVDLRQVGRHMPYSSEVRRELGIEPHELAILQVARLDHLKDHSTALRAMERLVCERPEARLILVGEGPERARIEAEIDQRRLKGVVRLLGLRTDVPRLLAAADLFLLSSISEGIPVTLIEAMGAALPIAATDVGGVSEVVVNEGTGLLAPAGDDRALAAAVARLAEDRALRQRLGQAGRERAERLFAHGRMHASYAHLYLEMIHAVGG